MPATETTANTQPWRVLWTRSNCEQLVHDQLADKGLQVFYPTVEAWSRRGGVRRRARVPMFGGYVFLRHVIDKATYVDVHKTRGVVRILGERWDQLAAVPDDEVESIQRVLASGNYIMPYPYLQQGQRVRITRGPLADVQGIVVRVNPAKGLLVVSVDLLQRSVAVHLDCTALEAA